jgi:signal peptidase I
MTIAFIALAAVAWWYLAPTRIGGSTTYVATHGISMEPRFHTGDLAVVRPVASYKVGEIVAYHSGLLHTVVLHRIVGRQGNLYVFKGDNNDFIDPRPVPRADLIGKLWLHIPRGGVVLAVLHTPIAVGALIAILGFAFVFGAGKARRRRKRRRKPATGSAYSGLLVNKARDHTGARFFNFGALLTASATAAVVFFVLAVVVFTRPAGKPSTASTPYTQQVTFGYSAQAPAGPVYPTGAIHTGDPIFLSLVHRVGVHIGYTFATAVGHDVTGTEAIRLRLTAQSGWTRTIVLAPRTHFTGDHTSTVVTLDIPQIESLLAKVGALTGMPTNVGYTIAVLPDVHVNGTVAGHPLNMSFAPSMSFELGPQQLVSNGASATSGSSSPGGASGSSGASGSLTPSQSGAVGTPSTAANTITVLGVSPEIAMLRWVALLGLLMSGGVALYAFLRKRNEPFEESVQIQAKYGHLIVPVVAGEDLGWPPVDVPNIKALVRLAESGQRLILHNRSGDVDTYMVNEEGTVYRYQVKASKIVWGEWTDAPLPVDQAGATAGQDSGNAGYHAANAA